MDKEVVTCTQWNIIQPLKRNTFESVLIRWINLELIIQSKVSQKEIIIIYKHIYTESRKMVQKNLFIGQPWRDRHREETYGHGERGGEDETFFTTSNPVLLCLC